MKNTISKSEFLFWLAYVPYLSFFILECSLYKELPMFYIIQKIVRYCTYLLLLLKILYDMKLQKKSLFQIALVVVCLMGSAIWAGEKLMLFTFLYMITSYNIKFDNIIKNSFWIHVLWMSIIIGGCVIGLLDNRVYEEGARIRYSLGYSYTTTSSNFFMHMIFMYVYWKKEKITWVSIVFIEFINLLLYKYTDTKMAFLMGTLVLLASAILKVGKEFREKYTTFGRILPFSVPVFAIGSVWAAIRFDENSRFWSKANSLLNSRLEMGNNAYHKYGLSLFGNKVIWTGYTKYETNLSAGQTYNYVDSSYMQLAVQYGLIFLCIICLYYFLMLRKSIQLNDIYMGMVIFVIILHGCTDPQLAWLSYNPFLLGFFYLKYNGCKDGLVDKQKEYKYKMEN